MKLWLLFPAAAGISFVITGYLRRIALDRGLLDQPNERSSHTLPTPRGGGVAIVVAYLGLLPVLWGCGELTGPAMAALAGAGLWVALVGFLDDLNHIPVRWRLLTHFLGAAWALAWTGGTPFLSMFGFIMEPSWIIQLLTLFYLVWLLNLYNFMDGIDGIAAVETLSVCLGAALAYALAVQGQNIWMPPLLLLSAVSGFLVWNLPPARIFMGDAGSGFLGMVLGVLSIQAAWLDQKLIWSWLILLGVFIVDATVTLLHRMLRGEKLHQAHRSHAYQKAARKYGRHWPVTLGVLLINLGWLLPIAAAVAAGVIEGAAGLMLAYLPLVLLAGFFGAGAPDHD